MASTTTAIDSINTKPSKAAEIYREVTGNIYYVCFHCGFNSSSISDTLIHIETHFSSEDCADIIDEVDIKCEVIEEDAVELTQLEQIFIDCSTKPTLNRNNPFPDDDTKDLIIPEQLNWSESTKSFTDLEGLFEWKCLHCNFLFKRTMKLQQHLMNLKQHNNLQMVRVIDENNVPMRAAYAFKCTLCSSEFYNAFASEQHLQDSHQAAPPLNKCIPCCIRFPSAERLKEHMTASHSTEENKITDKVSTTESGGRRDLPHEAKCKLCVCMLCDKIITGTLEFMQHTFSHFDLKIFSCPQCPTNFLRIETFNRHMKTKHTVKLPYKFHCTFCNDNVDHLNLLDFVTHAFEHHLDDGERNLSYLDEKFDYHCRFCFKKFDRWIDASTHLTLHAKDELPKGLPATVSNANERHFSERAKSGTYRSEFLFNCSICMSTLCGSHEARNHLISDHQIADDDVECWTMDAKLLSIPVQCRVLPPNGTQEKKRFECYDCDSTFDTEHYLMRHRLTHFNVTQPYACTICSRSFYSLGNITRHRVNEHGLKSTKQQLTCKFCLKSEFANDSEFISHNFNDHLYVNFTLDEDLDDLCKYECRYCGEITCERDLMDQHLQTHISDEISEEAKVESRVSAINKLHHKNEFMYICLRCPKKFRLPSVLKEHAKFVHHDKPKRSSHCDICSCTFYTWRSLRNHQAKMHPEMITTRKNPPKKNVTQKKKPSKKTLEGSCCDICKTTFLNNRSMINHRTKRHPETVTNPRTHALYDCSVCGKSFTGSNLKRHRETHEKLQSFTCDICGKSYRLKNSLQTHMFFHMKQKNFVCEECGKSFYTTSKLNLHKQQHDNVTIHCDKCGKVFYTRYNFSKHKRTHADNARKSCTLCDNTFKSAGSLRIHMQLHASTKKYSCRYCDAQFAQSSGRRGHERMKHENL